MSNVAEQSQPTKLTLSHTRNLSTRNAVFILTCLLFLATIHPVFWTVKVIVTCPNMGVFSSAISY